MNLSHAQQQKLLADNRRKEIAREDQIKRINQERTLEANMASEERIENKRFLRRLHQEATEREMDEGIRKVKAFFAVLIWYKILKLMHLFIQYLYICTVCQNTIDAPINTCWYHLVWLSVKTL